jgi:carbamoyl-phosphate synthase large subunit
MEDYTSKKVKVAVTGAGGGVGQSIIKALADSGYEVVALDGEVLAAGLYATRTSYLIPYANAPDYVDRLLEICKKEDCKILFPGLDAELSALSKNRQRFEDSGIKVIVSSPDVIKTGDDKYETYRRLSSANIEVPKTVDMSEYGNEATLPLPLPFVLKKRVGGARSKDVYIIDSQDKFQSILATNIDLSEFVAQEYIEGEEYTCGTVNLDGNCYGVIVMSRILRDGDTYKCFTVNEPVIEKYVRRIVSEIKPFGACNIQLRVKDSKPYVFEINARCSGTTAARALCGFNEPKMIADYICDGKLPAYEIKYQAILRYWKELVVQNETIENLSTNGSLSTNTENPL